MQEKFQELIKLLQLFDIRFMDSHESVLCLPDNLTLGKEIAIESGQAFAKEDPVFNENVIFFRVKYVFKFSCEKKEYPVLAVIKATLACNLKCVYCYANAGLDQSAHMSVETAHRIVDEYVRLNPNNCVTMLMHGGEPLINFKLVKDVFEYSKK